MLTRRAVLIGVEIDPEEIVDSVSGYEYICIVTQCQNKLGGKL